MHTYAEQLRALAVDLNSAEAAGDDVPVAGVLAEVDKAVASFGRAWSGSNLGYHSCVYYENFKPPPAGAHFSSEWGFLGVFSGTTGQWKEYDREDVLTAIMAAAGSPDLTDAESKAQDARTLFAANRGEITCILSAYLRFNDDSYISDLLEKINGLQASTEADMLRFALHKFSGIQVMSRDSVAIGQGSCWHHMSRSWRKLVRCAIPSKRAGICPSTRLCRRITSNVWLSRELLPLDDKQGPACSSVTADRFNGVS